MTNRWGSLANERALLDLLDGDHPFLQPTSLTLAPLNSNIYARRHSAHTCSVTEEQPSTPVYFTLFYDFYSKRNTKLFIFRYRLQYLYVHHLYQKRNNITVNNKTNKTTTHKPTEPPPLPPTPKCRTLPQNPFAINKPKPPIRQQVSIEANNINHTRRFDVNRNCPKQSMKATGFSFDGTTQNSDTNKMPPAPIGPPPAAPKVHKATITSTKVQGNQPPHTRVSIRQDSSISSDSFSQTSSPSYTTKTMETPLLPPRTPLKQQNGGLIVPKMKDNEDETNGNSTITKSASTPASLQTIVRFQNGSNMSLHHRIIRDMRRPSSLYTQRLKFRFIHLIINAIALFAIGAGMAAYFKAYPNSVTIVNKTVNVTASPILIERKSNNPAPGICLPIIVNFCKQHAVPYNYTVNFPNYMGNCGQIEAQQELEVYDAVVDVRCYDLASLFLCSLFVPKCGPNGVVVGPCRSLCYETKRRCGFFLDVFGLSLPDYLECSLFPESIDSNICVGHHEVKVTKQRAAKPVSYKVESMLPLLDVTDKDELELKEDKYDDGDVDTEEKEAYEDSDD
ncbi:hypothetical protein NQ317_011004 [Molorchus minor]|uniref:FZ domain-containing protein n=1 Tax=Molorchus minor TaxID=1323400 RepID=A0ABQ9K4J4_9CUCU|nr:hypothetical protein NQ317_011004 [Molorchus minor]